MVISWKMEGGVLSFADERGRVASFDLEGRLIYFTFEDATYRRTLLNKFVEMKIENGRRVVRPIPSQKAEAVVKKASEAVQDIIREEGPTELRAVLSGIAGRVDYAWLSRDAELLTAIYEGGIPIIPPDQYFSLYLRYTDGCPWNRCSFCGLYPDVNYRVRSIEDVETQLDSLLSILGRGVESRRSVFLGDANAINTDINHLLAVLELVKRRLNLPVYAFSDAFTTPRTKGKEDFILMKENGLKRIYIGIESGDEEVLRILNKPMALSVARREIEEIKAAGMGVGIIVMSGAGGLKLSRRHVENTSQFLATLPLGREDIVYVSPIREYQGTEYMRILREERLGFMDPEEKMNQADEIIKHLKEAWINLHSSQPEFQIAPYLLEESIY